MSTIAPAASQGGIEEPAGNSGPIAYDSLASVEAEGTPVASIPVHVSYEIIRLFSEGLYQSPQKAVEELVSNSYDANATEAHVLIPDAEPAHATAGIQTETSQPGEELQATDSAPTDGDDAPLAPLWVIDNGDGLNQDGFTLLWRVADSKKRDQNAGEGRLPIGQFGIGKLAAYVLAWRLTHISKSEDKIRLTSMNFRRIEGKHQYDTISPLDLSLREVSEAEAQAILKDVEGRDPDAWRLMFGEDSAPTWTAAALSDFKDLYGKLAVGRLSWVLRTGLPLHSKFAVWLDGKPLESSKESLTTLVAFEIGSEDDLAAKTMSIGVDGGILIPGIEGTIQGSVRLFERKLTEGKSDQYGRSNGFFVKVRGRVINLEDELFGLPALNHAAWSRFSMEINADGLRHHLLSSREGVRESEAISVLRSYMHGAFNQCRTAYEKQSTAEQVDIDINRLLSSAPSAYVTEPLVESVRKVAVSGEESFYFAPPPPGTQEANPEWLDEFARESEASIFDAIEFRRTGERDRAIKFFPDTRILQINEDHPFIDKLLSTGRSKAAATFFGSSELFVDALLQDYGVPPELIVNVLTDRDRVLRVMAGTKPSTAAEALRLLKSAESHDTALERAVGVAFGVLGFEFQRRGGYVGGTDGVLYARLGKGSRAGLEDYKLVYDAKTTSTPSVDAAKIDILSLEDFRTSERADYGFFIATKYAGEDDPESKVNKKLAASAADGKPVTTLKVEQLRRLVELHYRHGVTLTRMRTLFTSTHNVLEVEGWLTALEAELMGRKRVPLQLLLQTLERAKADTLAVPTVTAARIMESGLAAFTPEDLLAHLGAVSTLLGTEWIEVDPQSGEVRLHARAAQITAEVERHLHDLLGVDSLEGVEEYRD